MLYEVITLAIMWKKQEGFKCYFLMGDIQNRYEQAGPYYTARGMACCRTSLSSSLAPSQTIWTPRQSRMNAESRSSTAAPLSPSRRRRRLALANARKISEAIRASASNAPHVLARDRSTSYNFV